jgi:hypothetical protein
MARTMLIHAQQRWPDAITTNLWPYAIRMANDAINASPSAKLKDNPTPIEAFSGSNKVTNPKHWHHFGCPAFVLQEPLQDGANIFHKWKERAKVGVYLGRSPQHAKNVALVLSLETGLVSPQFHCKLDSTFQTLLEYGTTLPKSNWQHKAGFVHQGHQTPPDVLGRESNIPPAPTPAPMPPLQADPDVIPQGMQVPEGANNQEELPPLRRSTRQRRPVDRLTYSEPVEIFSLSALCPVPMDKHPLMAYAASAGSKVMYIY